VRRLKAAPPGSELATRLAAYLAEDRPFAVCLAQRLIDHPQQALAETAARIAAQHLQASDDDDPTALASAAAVVADFGTPAQQQLLLDLLNAEPKTGRASGRYAALAAGVTNSYTPNRIAYLAPLLLDRRPRPEPQASFYRYCDTAAARLVSITNQPHHSGLPGAAGWDEAVARAGRWLSEHPQSSQLSQLVLPPGNNAVRTGTRSEIDGRNQVQLRPPSP
jgi:hypothetical protein